LPSNCSGRRKNNLRDPYCCTTTSISRAREFRYRIGNKYKLKQEESLPKLGREPEKKKPVSFPSLKPDDTISDSS
jgi:hypothetical protein